MDFGLPSQSFVRVQVPKHNVSTQSHKMIKILRLWTLREAGKALSFREKLRHPQSLP